MTFGIVGYGRIGKLYHQILKDKGYSDFIICDISQESQVQNYKDSTLKDCNVVIISTPPNSHLEICKYFLLETEVKVVIEKPAIIDKAGLTVIEELYAKYQRRMYFAYHTLFNPLFVEDLDKKAFTHITVESKEDVAYYHGKNSWIYNKNISGGGCIIDSGINIFSVLCKHVQDINVVKCSTRNDTLNVEDFAVIDLYSSTQNVEIQIFMNWNYKDKEVRNYNFLTKDGNILVDIAQGKIISSFTKIESQNLRVDQQSEYSPLVDDFILYFDKGISKVNFNPLQPMKLVFDCYALNQD